MSKIDECQNIVVVGGGGAGASAVNELSAKLDPSKYNLILITARPYFTHLVGCIRMMVSAEGKLEDRVLIPYDKNFVNGNGTLLVGKVVSITDEGEEGGFVVLSNGERVNYSILILAPGSSWEGPLAMPDTKEECLPLIMDWREKFRTADDILLVGGGAVSVEYAGEIKELYPSKKVTIIHGQSLLLNDSYPDKWRRDVERRIRARGVDVVLGDYVPDDVISDAGATKTVITRNGATLTPDLIIPCRGNRPNTSFIASLGADTLNARGQVKILPTFQLLSHPRIFAGGDVTDWPEQKQVGKCYTHASIIATNAMAILSKKKAAKIYKGAYEMIVITIGKSRGASYFGFLWGLTFGDWVSSLIKSRGLMIDMTRRRLGLKD